MNTPPIHIPLHVVVLKWDRLYGELIRRHILMRWRGARVHVFQRGFDALTHFHQSKPDLFVTGVKVEDMDGLEHLEPFMDTDLPILVVTSRVDPRVFEMLREVRYDGIFDAVSEGLEMLPKALTNALAHQPYVSPTIIQHLKRPKEITLDSLTDAEQVVLSVIGDGADDDEAAARLGISPFTVETHRRSIMRKLNLHHKGLITRFAAQQGYVLMTPHGVHRPGFERRIARAKSRKEKANGKPLNAP